MHSGKVFGIGLSRTGTTSLAMALEVLGYRTKHAPLHVWDIAAHDATTDISVAARYRFLDRMFPGAKFILTVRDLARWLESCRDHWREQTQRESGIEPPILASYREPEFLVYGGFGFDAERFAAAYRRHEHEVREYFADRPGDLLVMDICGGDGWQPLLEFLGAGPDVPFPCRNARERHAAGEAHADGPECPVG